LDGPLHVPDSPDPHPSDDHPTMTSAISQVLGVR
jgi:hypothetical protein